MSRVFRCALVGLAVTGLASMANAQVCVGTPSFSVGSARASGSAMFSSQSDAYGAGLALGAYKGWFVSGAFAHAKVSNSDQSSNFGGGSLGYEWTVNSAPKVEVCPMVGVYTQSGSLVGAIADPYSNNPQNSLEVHVGGSVGWVASSSDQLQVIPAIGVAFVSRSYKAKIVQANAPNPTTSQSFGVLDATIGFVFAKRWTLSPMVTFPTSSTYDKPTYGAALSLNIPLFEHLF